MNWEETRFRNWWNMIWYFESLERRKTPRLRVKVVGVMMAVDGMRRHETWGIGNFRYLINEQEYLRKKCQFITAWMGKDWETSNRRLDRLCKVWDNGGELDVAWNCTLWRHDRLPEKLIQNFFMLLLWLSTNIRKNSSESENVSRIPPTTSLECLWQGPSHLKAMSIRL